MRIIRWGWREKKILGESSILLLILLLIKNESSFQINFQFRIKIAHPRLKGSQDLTHDLRHWDVL